MKKRFNQSVLVFLILSVGFLLLSRCRFKVPTEPPTWDVDLIIPLVNKMYTMTEIADDVDQIKIDPVTNEVIFTVEDEIDPFEVGDYLYAAGGGKEREVGFGTIELDSIGIGDGSILLDYAEIKDGEIVVEVVNNHGYEVTIQYEMPDIVHGTTGLPLSIHEVIPAFTQRVYSYPLNGYVASAPVWDGKNYIRFSAHLSGGIGGTVHLRVDVSDLTFYTINGRLEDLVVQIDSLETAINIPQEYEGFEIESAELRLALLLGMNVPVEVDILIQILSARTPTREVIHIQQILDPQPGRGAVADTIVVPDVASFINAQPTKILLTGSLKIGDGDIPTTVRDSDTISGSLLITAPLILKLPSQMTTTKVDTIEIDEDAREAIRDHLMQLTILADLENHLPASAEVSVHLSKTISDSTIFENADLIIGPVRLEPALLSGTAPAVVTEPSTYSWSELLEKEPDLQLFESEQLFWATRLTFEGTMGQRVKVRPSDYVHIRAHGLAKVHADFKDKDEEKGGTP